MLSDYNQYDYDLLLKRARIRQCLMKYEEAALDANFAMHIQPHRLPAYQALAEFWIALNNYPEALKLLEILHFRAPGDAMIKSQYEQIRDIERKR
jgi:tetratricopeptide (TPR) repeat protein